MTTFATGGFGRSTTNTERSYSNKNISTLSDFALVPLDQMSQCSADAVINLSTLLERTACVAPRQKQPEGITPLFGRFISSLSVWTHLLKWSQLA